MFGFLRLRKRGLSEADALLYRAQFCGSCHAMRAFGGRPVSLLTNYDQAFLHLVAAALESQGAAPPVEWRGCTAIPFRKVPVQVLTPTTSRAVAALTVALVEAKLRDDLADEKGRLHTFALRLVSGPARQAVDFLRGEGFAVERLETLAERQAAAEADPHPSLHALSDPTADLLGEIFAWIGAITSRADLQVPLRALGSALGRFIYVWDAVTDADRDRARGAFNALQAVYGDTWPRDGARAFLAHDLDAFEHALEALPAGEYAQLEQRLASSIRHRLNAALPVPRCSATAFLPELPGLRGAGQRGDCDCDCGGCDNCGDCCDGCDCCSDCDCARCGNLDCCKGGKKPKPQQQENAEAAAPEEPAE